MRPDRWSQRNAELALFAIPLSAVCGNPLPYVLSAALSLAILARGAMPLGLASRVTVARAAIVCASGVIGLACPLTASVALLTAALLDLADGAIARRRGEVSARGAKLDVEADAYLVATLCLLAVGLGRAGMWLVIPALLRPLLVLARAASHVSAERRTPGGRAAFGLLASALVATCAFEHRGLIALLALAVAAVSASFAVDFWIVLSGQRRSDWR